MALPGYEIQDRVQHGGQGVVYRARHVATNRSAAVKVLLDGQLATDRQRFRFEHEARITARLRHPHIVTLYDYGVVYGRPYIVMEFVNGLSITDHVVLHDLPARATVAIFIKVCRAVHCAHQSGIIHRDLNPWNILVDDGGEPHILDFGLATIADERGESTTYSRAGQVIGAPPYLSPEQAGGLLDEVDVRSDVYTLGVVLYELLTDSLPCAVHSDWAAQLKAIIEVEPTRLRRACDEGDRDRLPDPEAINRDLEAVVAKGLAKEKQVRYQSAAALADDLERYLAGDAVAARTGDRWYVVRKTLRKYRGSVLVAAALLTMLAVSGAAITKSLFITRIERDNARNAARVAYGLFDRVLTFHDAVRPLAGGRAIRDELLTELADRMPALTALIRSDVQLEPMLISLEERLGDLAVQRGARAEAAEHYATWLERSVRPDVAAVTSARLNEAGRAFWKLAAVSSENDGIYVRGIEFAHKVVEDHPDDDEARRNLCQLHLGLGEQQLRAESLLEAIGNLETALAMCPPSVTHAEDDGEWARVAAVILSAHGQALLRLGRGAEGIVSLEQSLRLRERILQKYPADTGARHALLLAYLHVSDLKQRAGQAANAVQLLGRAAATGDLLCALDPTVFAWQQDCFAAHERLTVALLENGTLDECRQQAETAQLVAGKLRELEPAHPAARSVAASALILQGRVFTREERYLDALGVFEQAVAQRAQLLATDPSNPMLLKLAAAAHTWLGQANRKAGRPDVALEQYVMADEIAVRLVQGQPRDVGLVLDLVQTRTNRAVAHLVRRAPGDDDAASMLLGEADAQLAHLSADGKLGGVEGKYQAYCEVIARNRRILRTRANATAEQSAMNSGGAEPEPMASRDPQ